MLPHEYPQNTQIKKQESRMEKGRLIEELDVSTTFVPPDIKMKHYQINFIFICFKHAWDLKNATDKSLAPLVEVHPIPMMSHKKLNSHRFDCKKALLEKYDHVEFFRFEYRENDTSPWIYAKELYDKDNPDQEEFYCL